MKKWVKVTASAVLGSAALMYAGFLFVLPNVIDLNKYKTEVQNLINEQTKLNIDFQNPKIITTPLLGAGVKADNITIKLPDDSILFSADSIKTRIALPSLFLLTVKVSCLDVEKPFINLEIKNNENFKIVQLVEDMLNEGKEQRLEEGKQTVQAEAEGLKFNPEWIRIKVPAVKLHNYRVLVNDLKSKHYLDLKGEELVLGYFNGKTAKVKTYAELYSDENKNITANVNLNTFLPEFGTKLDKEDDPAERVDIPFVNPVTMYRNYDLKANLDTKLRIRNHGNQLSSFGHFNIDGITLKVADLELPESYLHADTFGSSVNLETNIYPVKDQYINLAGNLNYGKHPKVDMSIRTGTIKFNDLLILSKAFLDSLHIKNELAGFRAEGYLNADCRIKTNFKKLNSFGSILVSNGGVNVRNLGRVLSKGNINIKLDNNILDVRNSSILIGGSPLYIDGKIDEKSVADINISADKLPLATLFNAFAPEDMRKNYNFKSGNATLKLNITGKLKDAAAGLKFGLDNLSVSGTEYPLAPGESCIISQFAANHQLDIYNPQSPIDGSSSEFEFNMNNPNFPDQAAYDMQHVFYQGKAEMGSIPQYLTSVFGGAYVIFRVPEGEAWDPVNDENMKTTDLSKPNSNVYYAKIPIKYVLDAVEAVNNESKMNAKRVPGVLDAGITWVGATYCGLGIARKLSTDEEGNPIIREETGTYIYQDTNNSTDDFERGVVPVMRRNGAKMPSWNHTL